MTTRLSAVEMDLLNAVVLARVPENKNLVEGLGERLLTDEEREEIRDIRAEEMLARGVDEHGELDQYGRQLDHIIGRLMWY